jgi:ribonucleoside-diphosphate reductase alpha chain
MHLTKYAHLFARNPQLQDTIEEAYRSVAEYKILPSMRSMQFAGDSILRQNARIYNCGYIPIQDVMAFREIIYLLLCGTKIGYSVQRVHVSQLPPITISSRIKTLQIEDSIEGWAHPVDFLMRGYLSVGPSAYEPRFDPSQIRPKGSLIHSIHAKAPGPDPLMNSLGLCSNIFKKAAANGQTHLRPLDVMDIVNILSECVLADGIRRSAMISLFSPDDMDVMRAKTGEWYKFAPWRARSNNSAILYRNSPSLKQDFDNLWSVLSSTKSGEPGIYFTNDPDLNWGTNPCVETALRPYQFCNLTEINAASIESQADFNDRNKNAAIIGTLQAGYTDIPFLSQRWIDTTKKDALLGVGLTGVATGKINKLDESEAACVAVATNAKLSKQLGINSAARVTCIKPSGTTSLLLGGPSGIHPPHSQYYLRRIRLTKQDELAKYFMKYEPSLIEDDVYASNTTSVLTLPVHMPSQTNAYRDESAMNFLDRVKRYNDNWVASGHVDGINTHNVSATVSIRDAEWQEVGKWLWSHRNAYMGISCFPMMGGDYVQAPFEECDKATFNRLYRKVKRLNLDDIDNTDKSDIDANTAACAGGACEL